MTKKISQLPAAGVVTGTDEFEINQTGISKKATADQISTFIDAPTGPASSTDTAIATWNGTGGDDLNDTGVLIDASDNLSGIINLNMTGRLTIGSNVYYETTATQTAVTFDIFDFISYVKATNSWEVWINFTPQITLTPTGILNARVGFDKIAAGTLEIGTTNATDIDLKKDTKVSGTLSVDTIDDDTAGFVTFSDGIKLPTYGGTAAVLDFYEESSSFTPNFDPVGGASATWGLTTSLSKIGNIIHLTITGSDSGTITGGSPTQFQSDTTIDLRFRPTADVCQVVAVRENSTNNEVPGLLCMTTSGALTLTKDIDGNATWASGNNAGIVGSTLSWVL